MTASKLSELFRAWSEGYRWEQKEPLLWATLWKAEHTGIVRTQMTKIDTDWSAEDFSGQPHSSNSTSIWGDVLGVLRGITLIAMNAFPVYTVEERHEGIPRQRMLQLEHEMQQQNAGAVTWWLEVADGEATQVLLKLSAKGVAGEGMTNCELTGPSDHLWNHRGGIEDIPLPSA